MMIKTFNMMPLSGSKRITDSADLYTGYLKPLSLVEVTIVSKIVRADVTEEVLGYAPMY